LLVKFHLCPFRSPVKRKVKQFHNTPMEEQVGEDLWLILIHDLGTRWG
jgi:hypothetical protein